jgi:putative membrane protein
MIVRPRPKAFQLFLILKGSTLPMVVPQIVSIAVFALLVVHLELRYFHLFHTFTPIPFTLLGIALSIFLGFRNSACYDRWWEARKLWGALINEMRALSRASVTLLPKEPAERVLRLAIAYAYALEAHLRRKPLSGEVQPYLLEGLDGETAESGAERVLGARNAPNVVLQLIGQELAEQLRQGVITDVTYTVFDERLTAIATIQGGCERIRNTPIPFAYTLLLQKTAYLFCFLLPFSLVTTFGYATPVFCSLVAYAFFGLDALGDQLEEPFGESQNALPLTALVRGIEIDLLEALGVAKLPDPLLPVDYLLV